MSFSASRSMALQPVAIMALIAAATPHTLPGQAPPEDTGNVQIVLPTPVPRVFQPARVGPLSDLRLVADGYWTAGDFGDILLANDQASFVIGRMPGESEKLDPVRAGALLDIQAGPRGTENFELFVPTLSANGARTLRTTSIDTRTDAERGTAQVTVKATSTLHPTLEVTTDYVLRRERSGVEVTTAVKNTGTEAVKVEVLGDYVNWGITGVFIPSAGWAQRFAAAADTEFVLGRYYDTFSLISPAKGLMRVEHNSLESRLIYERDVTIEPGQTRQYSRWILVGTKNPSGIFSESTLLRHGDNFGTIAGRIVERSPSPSGEVIDRRTAPNCEILIRTLRRSDLPEKYAGRWYLPTATDESGFYQVFLPPGDYSVDVISPFRMVQQATLGLKVDAGESKFADYGVSPPATLSYEIVDAETKQPLPGRLSLVPLRDSRPSMLGPLGSLTAENAIVTASGRGIAEVPIGNYRVIASHGTEYDISEQRLSFAAAKAETARFELRRTVPTDGWISADLGVRTLFSPDVRTTPEDRVATALAEGLDWIVTGDTGNLTDLGPAIEKAGAARRLRSSIGFRFPGEVLPLRGDYLVFPVEFCSDAQRTNFQLALDAQDPAAVARNLKALCPQSVVSLVRPAYPKVGFLPLSNVTPETIVDENFTISDDFDAYFVWEGKQQGTFLPTYQAYHALLARGMRFTALGGSFSGGTWNQEVGFPRVYIKSTKPDAEFDLNEVVGNIKRGVVQITNGPFIDLKVNGVAPGEGIVTEMDNIIEVELRVWSPNWAPVSSISIQANGAFLRQIMLPAGQDPEAPGGLIFPQEGNDADRKFRLLLGRDAVIEAIVESSQGLDQSVVNPHVVPTYDPKVAQGQRTLAISAPIFVDADGDGVVSLPKLERPTQQQPEPYEPPF